MNNVFNDIIKRTNKELYIGVVGAVRTGKSTFIKRFIENKVLKYVDSQSLKDKIVDELPHSAAGKQIMTVEPKFVPSNAVTITIDEELSANIRLVDCVGYVISGALGHYNEGGPKMVKTPWYEDAIPFIEAAEIGTNKVINNHSNIGIVITTDGTVTDFSRDDYVDVERNIIKQMQDLKKPFVVVLNTLTPASDSAKEICKKLEKDYKVSVIPCNVDSMNDNDIDRILKEALNEFEIKELNVKVPSYLSVLEDNNPYKKYFNDAIADSTVNCNKIKDVYSIVENLKKYDKFKSVKITNLSAGEGTVDLYVELQDGIYNEILNYILEIQISTKGDFIKLLQDYKIAKNEYDSIKDALQSVRETGYGISLPMTKDMTLEEPEVIKQSGRYGVRLKAIAPSIHMMRVDVESTFEPIIGTEEQSKALINNLFSQNHEGQRDVWQSEIFGRKLNDVVNDGIRSKIYVLPDNAKIKFRSALEKVINQGNGRLIAIIL